jgi:exopolysaccharide biosynthesis polyprenyl glycosylphosphotransferase
VTIEIKNKGANYPIPQNEGAIAATRDGRHVLKNRIRKKYRGFQAPLSERQILLVSGDALIVMLAALAAFLVWHQTENSALEVANSVAARWYWFPILLGGWGGLAWLNDLYYIPYSLDKVSSAMRVASVGVISLIVYLAIFTLIPNDLPRVYFLYFLTMVWPAITLWRYGYATLFSRLRHRVLIVGRGERGQSMARVLRQASTLNYQVLGYMEDGDSDTLESVPDDLPVLGRVADLPRLVQQLQIQEVVVAIEQNLRKDLFEWLVECQARGVQVSWMPNLYERLFRCVPIQYVDPDWALSMLQGQPVFERLQLAGKRLLDLVLAAVGLVGFAPFMLLVALAIRLDSAGPVLYRQIRSGRAGKPFTILKFRTMIQNAEQDGQARWATKDDDRITRVGRFLRKTRLDELPQLVNVLRGEMSIVGPRPERPEFIEMLEQEVPFYRTRLMAKPGLTGWAQVHYSYGSSILDALIKLQYDFYYMNHWSLWLDIYIIYRTIWVALRFKGT